MAWAYFELVRPVVALCYAGLVLAGFVAVGFPVESPRPAALFIAAVALLTMGAIALNDVYDVEVDRVNKPFMPIPSGRVSVGGARRAAGALFAVGLAAGLLSASLPGLAALFAGCLGCAAYGRWSKRMGPPKNAFLASLGAAAVLLPGVVSGRWTLTLLLAALHIFLIGVSVEMAKDVEDMAGDARVGARTWAIVAGPQRARRVSMAFAAAAVLAAAAGALGAGPYPALRARLVAAETALAAAAFMGAPRIRPGTLLLSAGSLGLCSIVLVKGA